MGVYMRPVSATPLVLFLPLLFIMQAAIFCVLMGTLQILLPSQIAIVDPAHKVAVFGTLTGLAAIVATIANPLAGAASDRMRGRFGRRAPWMVAGALSTIAAAVVLGTATSIVALGVGICLLQATVNLVIAPVAAAMPERVAEAARGRASVAIGLGFPMGTLAGTAIASRLAATPLYAYAVLAGVLIVAVALFVVLAPEGRYDAPPEPTVAATSPTVGGFFAALADHDFRWTFVSRFLLVLAAFMIIDYQLYILQDAIRLPPGAVPTATLATLTAYQTTSLALATLAGGWVSDRSGRRKPFVMLGAIGVAIGAVAPMLSANLTGATALALFVGAGFGCYLVVDAALVTQVLPSRETAARDLGILNIANAGPQIAAPFCASVIILGTGGYAGLFVAVATLSIASGLAVLRVRGVR